MAAAAAAGGIGRVPAARHTAGWQGTHSEIDHSRVYTLAQLLLVMHRTTLYTRSPSCVSLMDHAAGGLDCCTPLLLLL
jgi:hypothetical protein